MLAKLISRLKTDQVSPDDLEKLGNNLKKAGILCQVQDGAVSLIGAEDCLFTKLNLKLIDLDATPRDEIWDTLRKLQAPAGPLGSPKKRGEQVADDALKVFSILLGKRRCFVARSIPLWYEYEPKQPFGSDVPSQSWQASQTKQAKIQLIGPLEYSARNLMILDLYFQGLTRLPLTESSLSSALGLPGAVAPRFIRHLIRRLTTQASTAHVQWTSCFTTIYGKFIETPQALDENLTHGFGDPEPCSVDRYLFSVHTYLILVFALIAGGCAELLRTPSESTVFETILSADRPATVALMHDLLTGTKFERFGLDGFGYEDFWGWFLEDMDEETDQCLKALASKLQRFHYATSVLVPWLTQDLFRNLYERLIPRIIRHRLGEYFTPTWLADLVLNRVEYSSDQEELGEKRLIDPSCGSGVFLIKALQRLRSWADQKAVAEVEMGNLVCRQIAGLDLNPVSVAAARTNYLVSIVDLLWLNQERLTLPIYRYDSILGKPMVESHGRDIVTSKFDYVVGNPPWIRWGYLPDQYKEATKPLWFFYNLFTLKGNAALLGGGEKDLCMLFTYRAADPFLAMGGRLGLIVSQVVFKAKGAGSGFRRFTLPDGVALRVSQVDDLTALHPFPGARNKPVVMLMEKGTPTKYPVPYQVWSRQGKYDERLSLGQVMAASTRQEYQATPLDDREGSVWYTTRLDSQRGPSWLNAQAAYRAYIGARTDPYGVYWVSINARNERGLLHVVNIHDAGKTTIPRREAWIEEEYVYPALRGSDIERWQANPGINIIMVQDRETRAAVPEQTLKRLAPRLYEYLLGFEAILRNRRSGAVRRLMTHSAFYTMFAIGPYTFSNYKVVWRRLDNRLRAAVVSSAQSPSAESRTVLPIDTVTFIPTDSEAEAHFICALMNSQAVAQHIAAFSSAGRGYGTPSILHNLALPRFQQELETHRALSHLSRTAHEVTASGSPSELKMIEPAIEEAVKQVFKLG